MTYTDLLVAPDFSDLDIHEAGYLPDPIELADEDQLRHWLHEHDVTEEDIELAFLEGETIRSLAHQIHEQGYEFHPH